MGQFTDLILNAAKSPGYRPTRAKELAKQLRVPRKDVAAFKADLDALVESGQILRGMNGLLRIPSAPGGLTGIVRRTARGNGYFVPHERAGDPSFEAWAIHSEDMRNALTGDEVLVRLLKRRSSTGRRMVRVMEILQRATNQFVGAYHEEHGQGYVTVEGSLFETPIAVGDPGAKGAKPNDQVVIEMVRFPSATRIGEAVLTKVLGERGAPGVDLLSTIYEFGLPDEFPEAVLEEARMQAQVFDEKNIGDRLDLTNDLIVTIDPIDARDFDDAISLEPLDGGAWRLGVHIADVAHFVQPGTLLDREASRRGNSVYLPGRVLPMLPEVLSNALASLQAGHVRFTKSAFIEYSAEGTVRHTEFANSAINVKQRFAYEQVLPILENRPDAIEVSEPVRALLHRMHDLAMLLRRRRFAKGALEMEMPEIKLDFDEQNHVAGAHKTSHDVSHQIIEEFMLAANVAVAQALAKKGWPFLRRVHGSPDELRMRKFAEFARSLDLDVHRPQDRKELQQLLRDLKGDPLEYPVSYALLRSMKQAEYSPEELEHYALAEPDYCHFTSPIRRYPDLTIHRLLDNFFSKRPPRVPGTNELVHVGKDCSFTERRAERAERELIKIRLLRYLADRIGEPMKAMITSVESFGFFCQGLELPAEGLVHLSQLPDDYYDYDEAGHQIVGRQSGTSYRLGDVVDVEVHSVDLDKRELNFRVKGAPERPRRESSGKFPKKSGKFGGPRRKEGFSKKSSSKKGPRRRR